MLARTRTSPIAAVAAAVILALAPLDARAEDAAPPIGTVKTLTGHAWVVNGEGRVPVALGTRVHQSDRVETEGDGALGITFLDNSAVSLGPGSRLALDRFIFDPRADRYSLVFTAERGTFLFVAGIVAERAPELVQVRAPTGVVGIHAKRFLVKVGG